MGTDMYRSTNWATIPATRGWVKGFGGDRTHDLSLTRRSSCSLATSIIVYYSQNRMQGFLQEFNYQWWKTGSLCMSGFLCWVRDVGRHKCSSQILDGLEVCAPHQQVYDTIFGSSSSCWFSTFNSISSWTASPGNTSWVCLPFCILTTFLTFTIMILSGPVTIATSLFNSTSLFFLHTRLFILSHKSSDLVVLLV